MRSKINSYQKEIRILERILSNPKAPREKKLLAMIGLVSMARRKT
ncbi:MAG: hypothetical protein ABH823_00855 [bacterium]